MDKQVNNFLQDLELVSPTHAEIVNEIRRLYHSYNSTVEEKFIYGGIGFFIQKELVGGAYPYKKHVSAVFSRGNELEDPNSLLEGGGKYRRHLKIVQLGDLTAKMASYFVKQVIDLETGKTTT